MPGSRTPRPVETGRGVVLYGSGSLAGTVSAVFHDALGRGRFRRR